MPTGLCCCIFMTALLRQYLWQKAVKIKLSQTKTGKIFYLAVVIAGSSVRNDLASALVSPVRDFRKKTTFLASSGGNVLRRNMLVERLKSYPETSKNTKSFITLRRQGLGQNTPYEI